MFKAIPILFTLIVTMTFLGCEQQPPEKDFIVIINLEQLFKTLGWNENSREKLAPIQQQIDQKLENKRQQIELQLQAAYTTLGDDPTNEQEQEFQQLRQKLSGEYENERIALNQQMTQARINLVEQYRSEYMPYARGAALKRGAKIILAKNMHELIDSDPSIDITDEVIEAMQKNRQANSVLSPPNSENPNQKPATGVTEPHDN